MKKERGQQEHKVKYGTVSLPQPLIEKIKKNMVGTGMNSVSAYVTFVLRQILSSEETKGDNILDKKTEKDVAQRLKKLGYI